jgi:hypothetical protein
MRDANSQRGNTMIRLHGTQQPSGSHVSHAEIGGNSGFKPSMPPASAGQSQMKRAVTASPSPAGPGYRI